MNEHVRLAAVLRDQVDGAARALSRLRGRRRPVTAVELRCAARGHLAASVHPAGGRMLLWRRRGRAGGLANEAAGFAALFDDALWLGRDVPGAAVVPRGVPLACHCGLFWTDDCAEDLRAAIRGWRVDHDTRTVRLVARQH